MSEPHKYHQRPRRFLDEESLIDLRLQESERERLGKKVSAYKLGRDLCAYLLRSFREQGMDNFTAKSTLMNFDIKYAEKKIRECAGRENIPHFILKPLSVAVLKMQLGVSLKEAGDAYDLFFDREKLENGLIDRYGHETDEVQQLAISATNQYPQSRRVYA